MDDAKPSSPPVIDKVVEAVVNLQPDDQNSVELLMFSLALLDGTNHEIARERIRLSAHRVSNGNTCCQHEWTSLLEDLLELSQTEVHCKETADSIAEILYDINIRAGIGPHPAPREREGGRS